MTIFSPLNKPVARGMDYTVKNWFAKSLKKGLEHPAEYAAKMMVLSFITKDAVNCGLYTYQSLHNEKIPEDKRGFVAALDLVNGVINIVGQFAAAYLVERTLTPWLETKFTGVYKNPKTKAETLIEKSKAKLAPDAVHEDTVHVMKENADAIKAELKKVKDCKITYEEVVNNIKIISGDVAKKVGHSGTIGKDVVTGLGIVVTALATTAFIKRTLTPLISTPLAGKLKDKFINNEVKKSADKNDPMLEATYKPWLTKAMDNKNDLNQDKFEKTAQKQG
jgi:hypothetical protein